MYFITVHSYYYCFRFKANKAGLLETIQICRIERHEHELIGELIFTFTFPKFMISTKF